MAVTAEPTLTTEQRETFFALADVLIPAAHGMPAASEAGAVTSGSRGRSRRAPTWFLTSSSSSRRRRDASPARRRAASTPRSPSGSPPSRPIASGALLHEPQDPQAHRLSRARASGLRFRTRPSTTSATGYSTR